MDDCGNQHSDASYASSVNAKLLGTVIIILMEHYEYRIGIELHRLHFIEGCDEWIISDRRLLEPSTEDQTPD